MAYKKRVDGRKFDEPRPIIAKAGIISKADGSGYFKIGDTEAYAAVYGPHELHPRFLQNPKKGVLRCVYNMLPFAGPGDRSRPGPNRRAKEISHVTKEALEPVLDLSAYPNAVIDVFIDLPDADAGSRCAGICAASIALADAGLQMKDMVVAVGVGMVSDKIVVDLNYDEESHEEGAVDIPVAMIPSTGEITLLQLDGGITKKQIIEAIEFGKPAFEKMAEEMRAAIHARFKE
jgi:exosome complex component RRP41